MKKIIFLLFLSFFSLAKAQNVQLAYDYFRKGEFQKSASLYEELYNKNSNNRTYFKNLLRCYQELENYTKADELLAKQKQKFPKQTYLLVEQGYNYQLQNQKEKAIPLYNKALKAVENKPSSAYIIGRAFQNNHLLDYALDTYKNAMKIKPRLNFNMYVANIYGEKGEIDNMFNSFLDMAEQNPKSISTIQRYVSKFITDDNQNENNILFRKLVLKRLQNNPNDVWNQLLSWLFMQQKDYHKALIQEKAIYKRNGSNLNTLFDLADISFQDRNYQTAKDAYTFIIDYASNMIDVLDAKNRLLVTNTKTAKTEEDFNKIEQKYKEILTEFGTGSNTVYTQINYADFLVFTKNKPKEAIEILKQAEKVAPSKYLHGEIKIKLADILVFTNKFNQALITYTQVQTDLRSSDIAQTARLKVAKTSYYKGDFDWAKTQLKVLKSATSKLISNDALKLNLLIGDNIAEDTIRTALKKYAKADLLAYQNKTQQAIDTLNVVLTDFKGHAIEDEALLFQAELFKKQHKFEFAEHNYQKIIKLKKDGILVDDAYYELGALYSNELNDIEKAKEMYQKIIFDYANSIFLVDARKKFRKLRGDIIDE
jgi:tetratricopeptide (TPR) repeat protein